MSDKKESYGTYVVEMFIKERITFEEGVSAERVCDKMIELINEKSDLFITGDVSAKCIAIHTEVKP